VIAGLLALFIGAGALALARGLEIECGCFFPLLTGDRLTLFLSPVDRGSAHMASAREGCGAVRRRAPADRLAEQFPGRTARLAGYSA